VLDFGEGDHCSVVNLYGTTALLGVGDFFYICASASCIGNTRYQF
jgi:hypothetical protein